MAGDDLLREAQDPSTGPARLAQIAQADPSTWRAVAGHPQAYDGLLTWLGEHGDDDVRAAIAGRAAASVAPPPPPPPPPSPQTPPPSPEMTQPLAAVPASPPAGPPTGPPSGPPTGPPMAQPYGQQPLGSPPPGPPARRSPNVALIAVAAVAALAVLGVGGYLGITALTGDDDTSDASATTSASPADPSDSSSPSSTESSDDSDSDGGGSTDDAFCSTLKDQQDASMDLLSSPGADPDLDKLKDQLADSARAFGDLADDGPAEISDDLRTMADYYTTLEGVSDGSGDPSDFSEQIQPFAEASQRVTTYYYQNCS